MSTKTKKTPIKSSAKAPANMTELRSEMADLFAGMLTGRVPMGEGKQVANVAGKIISTVKVQIDYAIARKEKPNIPFSK